MSTSMVQISTISGSFATFEIVVTPCARIEAMTRFSVAPTEGNSQDDVGSAKSVLGRCDEIAVVQVHRRTESFEAGLMHVETS